MAEFKTWTLPNGVTVIAPTLPGIERVVQGEDGQLHLVGDDEVTQELARIMQVYNARMTVRVDTTPGKPTQLSLLMDQTHESQAD